MNTNFDYVPTDCPVCDSKLEWVGANLYCKNELCANLDSSDLWRWLDMRMVKNLGGSTISALLDEFDINSIEDLYKFDKWDNDSLVQIEGIGGSTVNLLHKLRDNLNSPIKFDDFMLANNIPQLGRRMATNLGECYDVILNSDLTGDELAKELDKIKLNAPVRAGILAKIDKIRANSKYTPVERTHVVEVPGGDQEVICLTGKLSVSRGKFLEYAQAFGFIEGPINKARYLITDNPDSGSSKNKQAAKLKSQGANIDVVSETWFRDTFFI